jgi:hypothetical protein
MRKVTATLESLSPYGQSKYIEEPRRDKETANDHEKRIWRDRCHYDDDGHVFIPPISLKNCLQEAAKFLGEQIPGRGKERYTKHFEAGVMVLDGLTLPETRDTVEGLWLMLPSDGRVGGTSRVPKCMPRIPKWKGNVTFWILDDTITPSVFERTLREAGQFIGLGYWRPIKRGMWGRFRVVQCEWEEMNLAAGLEEHAA